MKKRICFITTLPVTLKCFVFPQAEYLLNNGWDVTCVCAEDPDLPQDIPEGIRYVPFAFKRGIDLWGAPGAIIRLNKFFKRECFNIVQYSTPNAAFYASTAAMLANVPVRLYAQWGIRYVGFKGVLRKIFKLMERWCCRCSTDIQPDSVSNLEFSVNECLYRKNKARVIWNGSACGVDLDRFNIEQKNVWRSEFRKKAGLKPEHLVIGFVGSIRRDKGCNELISACRSFFDNSGNARLLLIGDKGFYDTIDPKLRDWVASSKQVIHIPPSNAIPQYMACMDVFSLPSYREGFGMVIVEAESMGVPVVVSNVPGPIDAMRHENTGLAVPVKNTEALAAGLQSLLNDHSKRERFGASAADFARGNFAQENLLRHVLDDKERLLRKESFHS
ncbi:glycosyltransferase [PVC group bacterium]|nr:glycosyltransferase [PVC group bacterium]